MNSCRATKKGQAYLSFRPGSRGEVRLIGQDIPLPGNPHRFCLGSNSQIPVEIFNVELNRAEAQVLLVSEFPGFGSGLAQPGR